MRSGPSSTPSPHELPLLLLAKDKPRHAALYEALREAMLSGRLSPNARLPASRDLARQLGVARGTVVAAYDRLTSEGYLRGARGAGTFVEATLPDAWLDAAVAPRGKPRRARVPRLAKRGAKLAKGAMLSLPTTAPLPFRPHTPAIEPFPRARWMQLVSRRARRTGSTELRDVDARGYRPLREAIATHLRASRGVHCDAEQVLVVSGIHQALDLALRLLVDEGEDVWVEDPGYFGARYVIDAAGGRAVPVRVDARGIDVEHGIARYPAARFVYVTPAHQCPMGGTLSMERRLRLLEWADEHDAWIFEDDYDSEFRYVGAPVPALQGLDQRGVVLHAGTFTKTLFPALRLAYLVVPATVVDVFAAAFAILHRYCPLLPQAVLADFIVAGDFSRHLRRMRGVYAERRDSFLRAMSDELSDELEIVGGGSGFDAVGLLRTKRDERALCQAALRARLELLPLAKYALHAQPRSGLVLGHAAVSSQRTRRAAPVLRKVLVSGEAR